MADDVARGTLDAAALMAAFSVAPIGVSLSFEGTTEYCNPAYLGMFGYQGHEDEIYGQSLLSMIAPRERPAIVERIARRRAGEESSAYDSVGLRRDGTEFPFHIVARRLPLGGRVVTLSFFLDVSERVRFEEALRQSNEHLTGFVNASPIPSVMLDVEGRVQRWNPAAERTFGWTAQEVLGQRHPLISDSEHEEFSENLVLALTGALHGKVVRRRRRDGALLDLELYAGAVHDARGAPIGATCTLVDVTERQRAREALARSEEQLRHSQKMEAVGRLAGMVAHDFNNLLTVLTGFTDLLSPLVAEVPQAPEYVDEMQTALRRATALTRQLLAFSRRQVLSPTVLDLNQVVSGMTVMLEALAGAAIEVVTQPAADLGRVRADVGQLEQLIANLAVNAYDAMPRGGRLTLSTRNVDLDDRLTTHRFPVLPGRYVWLAVTDAGQGMSEEVLPRLFEPFFTTKERGKGTGLGLSTVLGIVQQSGGAISVETAAGQGSTFSIYLPRVAAELTPPAQRLRRTPLPWQGAVVLVEDNVALRRLVRGVLEAAGYGVLEARDARHALELLRATTGAPRLVLTDVLMPEVSGPELAQQVWQEAPEVPVVFMSGFSDPQTFPEEVRRRAAGFLAKPFDGPSLLRLVDDAIRGARGG